MGNRQSTPVSGDLGEWLEGMYRRYNLRRYAGGDPVTFLYSYPDPDDLEPVALVASALAFGRVKQILASVRKVLDRLGARPGRFLHDATDSRLHTMLADFRHRFVGGEELAAMLRGVRVITKRCGSLQRCFRQGLSKGDETFAPSLTAFAEALLAASGGRCGFLVPSPRRGSACKRLNLMLRWLVRRDAVDVGAWTGMDPARLLIPLDTHMHRMCQTLGLTRRKAADMRTVLEVTAGFAKVCPRDPVRYDFALTRPGILGIPA